MMLDFNNVMMDSATSTDFAPVSGLKVLDLNTPKKRLPTLEFFSGKLTLGIRLKLSEYPRHTFK